MKSSKSQAWDNIAAAESQILYKKVGKKYVPVNDPHAYYGLGKGYWLVKVGESSTTIRSSVWPDNVEVEAALRDLEDKILDILRKAEEVKPDKTKLDPKDVEAWERFIKKRGEKFRYLHWNSLAGIAEEIVGHVKKRVVEREHEKEWRKNMTVKLRDYNSHGDDDDGCGEYPLAH